METLIQDLRYGVRMLVKRPGFTLIAIIALALGIGANTAIFSVVNTVLLKPLPFAESDRLMNLWETNTQRGNNHNAVSYPDFADWRDQNQVFERMAAYHDSAFTLTGLDEPARLQGVVVSADMFTLLGASPVLGRAFLPEEDKPGDKGRVIILSHRLWKQRFNADSNILEKSLTLDGASYTIVGVMADGFQFPVQNEPIDLYMTFAPEQVSSDGEPMTANRGAHYLSVIGRLKPGVAKAQAQAEMDTIGARLEQQYVDTNKNRGVFIVSALEDLVGDVSKPLYILFGAVGCVLLIACANVANLLLARATTRHKELAIRAALGASRLRVVRQLLTESIILALAGGASGLLIALWGTDLLVSLSREDLPRVAQIGMDTRVLGFTLLVSLLTGVLFGLVPALQSSKLDLSESLKEGGRGSSDGARRNLIRSVLVVAEVAIAVVLLVGAALLIQSLNRLQHINPGFDSRNVLTLNLGLPDVKYSTEKQAVFYRDLLSRIKALPGVTSASGVLPLPLSQDRIRVTFETEGRPLPKSDLPAAEYRGVEVDYFRTMGIQLLRGRDFNERDDLKSIPVIIVNQAFAEQYFPGEDPIGHHIKPGISNDSQKPIMREIVGVVGNVKHLKLDAAADPEYYVPHRQLPFDFLTLVVKSDSDPRPLAMAIQQQVQAIDKDLPLYGIKLLDEYLTASVAQPRLITLLLAIFAGLALLLTIVGLYGVMSYSVVQRTHEIGIRMALGAETRDVLKMVVGQGLRLTLVGIGIGLTVAYALTWIMASLLYGVSATDPLTFAVVAGLLTVVAFVACFIPARRAAKVDPMIALRYE